MEAFRIIQPSVPLAPYVKQYWLMKSDAIGHAQGIIPTGYISMYFHRASPLLSIEKKEMLARAYISGQTADYSNLELTGSMDLLCVDFHPFGANAFFKIPLHEFRNESISIGDIEDKELLILQRQILNESDDQTCIHLIERFLIKRLHTFKDYNYNRILAIIETVNNNPSVDINTLADIACLSYKQFKRVFTKEVGTTPKEFTRIIRFQRALYALQLKPEISLTQLAFECGYYDQPHLIREFKSFSGYTPREYFAVCAPYSDYFTPI